LGLLSLRPLNLPFVGGFTALAGEQAHQRLGVGAFLVGGIAIRTIGVDF
jgi:hypothetical protein